MKSALLAACELIPSPEEAWSEVERELQVRARVYDKWVTDGKIAWADARDRYGRLAFAASIIKTVLDLPEMDGKTVLEAALKLHKLSMDAERPDHCAAA